MSKPKSTPPNLTEQAIQRFWSKVSKEPGRGPNGDCWLWTACFGNRGYGQFTTDHSRKDPASRIALYLASGKWPEYNACHTCDNPPCCNPEHLFDGTHSENAADRNAKGRQSRGKKHSEIVKATTQRGENHWCRYLPDQILKGEKNGEAKLTDAKVLEIRQKWSDGLFNKTQLSREYGVSITTITRVVTRKNWKHI